MLLKNLIKQYEKVLEILTNFQGRIILMALLHSAEGEAALYMALQKLIVN